MRTVDPAVRRDGARGGRPGGAGIHDEHGTHARTAGHADAEACAMNSLTPRLEPGTPDVVWTRLSSGLS